MAFERSAGVSPAYFWRDAGGTPALRLRAPLAAMRRTSVGLPPLLPLLLPRGRGLLVQHLLQPLRAGAVALAQCIVLLLSLRPVAELQRRPAKVQSRLRVVRVQLYRLPRRVARAFPILRPHARDGQVAVRRGVVGPGLDRFRQHLCRLAEIAFADVYRSQVVERDRELWLQLDCLAVVLDRLVALPELLVTERHPEPHVR